MVFSKKKSELGCLNVDFGFFPSRKIERNFLVKYWRKEKKLNNFFVFFPAKVFYLHLNRRYF